MNLRNARCNDKNKNKNNKATLYFFQKENIFDSQFTLKIKKKLGLIVLNVFGHIISTPHVLFPPEAMTEGTCAVQRAGFTQHVIM
jgi:hypothetical protein